MMGKDHSTGGQGCVKEVWVEEQDVGDATRSQLGVFEEVIQVKNKHPKWKLGFYTSVICGKKWVSLCGCLNTTPNYKPQAFKFF